MAMANPSPPDDKAPSPVICPGFSSTNWLACAVVALFGVALCVSLFLPAYVDDVLYLILDSRAGYDGWQFISSAPQCDNFITPIPPTLLPGRAWAWAIHTMISDWYTLRTVSLIILFSWIAFTAWALKRCIFPAQPWLYILAGIAGFTALGTLPFALVLGRPEIAMIFAITWYVFLPFLIVRYPSPPRWITFVASLLFLLVTSWFLGVHSKALFYVPLALVSGTYVCRWNKILGILAVAFTLIASYQAWNLEQVRMVCPGSEFMRQYGATLVLAPGMFFTNKSGVLWQAFINVVNTLS
jgi:hypothetical protein